MKNKLFIIFLSLSYFKYGIVQSEEEDGSWMTVTAIFQRLRKLAGSSLKANDVTRLDTSSSTSGASSAANPRRHQTSGKKGGFGALYVHAFVHGIIG